MARGVVVPMKHPSVPHKKPRQRRPRRRRRTPPPRSGMTRDQLIDESRRWLSIINAHKLNDYKRRKIVADTLDNFRLYYNKGYLEYRKSVTEGGEFAAIEWSGRGSHFEDITGRQFIDCLGRYGIYSAGINHPKIVRAVKSQLERMPLSLAGAARPAARRAGRAAGRAGARRPAELLLHQQRHGRHRGRHEAGAPLHRQARLHLVRARLPRQVLRRALAHGQGRVPPGRSSRCCRTSTSSPSATPTRSRPSCARPRRWAWRSPAWWWSRCRARRARSCRPTTTGRGCARSARATACC